MPFHTPQYPWIEIDHKRGRITCTRCKKTLRFPTATGLEGLMDNLPDFAHDHATCPEVPEQATAAVPRAAPRKQRAPLAAEAKQDVVLAFLTKSPRLRTLMREHGVSSSRVRQWTNRFLEAGLDGLRDDGLSAWQVIQAVRALSPEERLLLESFGTEFLYNTPRLLLDFMRWRQQEERATAADEDGIAYA